MVEQKNQSILIVDDNDAIREVLVDVLEDAGYQVHQASDGLKALSIAEELNIDLVITDIIMPDEDGIGTMMKLRKSSPDTKIIAISGGGRISPETYLEMAQQLGAAATFKKPFDLDEIVECVGKILTD